MFQTMHARMCHHQYSELLVLTLLDLIDISVLTGSWVGLHSLGDYVNTFRTSTLRHAPYIVKKLLYN